MRTSVPIFFFFFFFCDIKNFISMTLERVTSFTCIRNLRNIISVLGGIYFYVMAENWKHLKDALACVL